MLSSLALCPYFGHRTALNSLSMSHRHTRYTQMNRGINKFAQDNPVLYSMVSSPFSLPLYEFGRNTIQPMKDNFFKLLSFLSSFFTYISQQSFLCILSVSQQYTAGINGTIHNHKNNLKLYNDQTNRLASSE